MPSPTRKAIDLAGGPTALAVCLGERQPTVSNWLARDRIPAERVEAVCLAIDNAVTPHELRPDVFGDPAYRAARHGVGRGEEAAAGAEGAVALGCVRRVCPAS